MLPFLKEREGAASLPVDHKRIGPKEDYDLLSAIADDILAAVKTSSPPMLKAALSSFMNHIRDTDEMQDQTMEGDV
jgi:hypothetical protein